MGRHRRLSLRGRLDHAQGRLLDVAPATGARGLGLGERHASAMRPTVHLVEHVLREVTEAIDRDFERVDALAGAHGVVAMLTVRVDDAFFDAAGPQLRVVANYAVGVDNVDLEAARRRGIVVTNTPDVLTRATAELTVALILALVRRVAEGDRLLRRRGHWAWAPTFMLGRGLEGKTRALVGYG